MGGAEGNGDGGYRCLLSCTEFYGIALHTSPMKITVMEIFSNLFLVATCKVRIFFLWEQIFSYKSSSYF